MRLDYIKYNEHGQVNENVYILSIIFTVILNP